METPTNIPPAGATTIGATTAPPGPPTGGPWASPAAPQWPVGTHTAPGPWSTAPWPPGPGPSGPTPPAAPPGAMRGPGVPGGPSLPRPDHRRGQPPDPSVRPDRRALLAVVAIAVAVDAALRTRLGGVAGFVLAVVAACALVLSGRLHGWQSKAVAMLALPFGLCLAVRTSWWLIPLDVLVIVGALVVATMFGRGGNVFDIGGRELGRRIVNGIVGAVMAPAFVLGAIAASLPATDNERRERRVAVVRGIGFALPVLVVLGLLLASSDPVFAALLHLPVDGDSLLANGLLLFVGLWVAGALLRTASEPNPPTLRAMPKPFGAIEAVILLGGLILLYGGFALTQLVTAMGGADHVLGTANLTRADYARTGFFQLLAVAGLTLGVLGVMKCTTEAGDAKRSRRAVAWMSEVAVALTLAIVAVAIIRLDLYDDAYGLTMLRLFSLAAAWWLGVVFVLVGVALAGVGRHRHWLLGAIVLTAMAALLAMNVVDPEAYVVAHNAGRYESAIALGRAAELDVDYTELLSDDAVPALAAVLPKLDARQQRSVLDRICGVDRSGRRGPVGPTSPGRPDPGVLSWNRSVAAGQRIREELCR